MSDNKLCTLGQYVREWMRVNNVSLHNAVTSIAEIPTNEELGEPNEKYDEMTLRARHAVEEWRNKNADHDMRVG